MRPLGLTVVLSLMTVVGRGSTLYTNGPISGAIGGTSINQGFEVTDSFVLSFGSLVTGVSNIGLWVYTPDVPVTLSWVISTAPDGGGTVEGSGAGVALSNSFVETVSSFDIYSASFSTGSVALSAGTYYLELFNATTIDSGAVFWDINGGPSTADSNGGPTASESFEIDGVTPEPTSVVLSGLGLMALAGMARWRGQRFHC
jgi:hypothetical protein